MLRLWFLTIRAQVLPVGSRSVHPWPTATLSPVAEVHRNLEIVIGFVCVSFCLDLLVWLGLCPFVCLRHCVCVRVWSGVWSMEHWIMLHFPFAYELPTPNILHSYSCHIYKMHSSESTSAKEVETKTRSSNIENTIPNNLKAIKPTDLCQIMTRKLGHDPSTTKKKIVLLWCDRLYTEIKTKNI